MLDFEFKLPFELPFELPFNMSELTFTLICISLILIILVSFYSIISKKIKKMKLAKKVKQLGKAVSNNKKEYFEINLKKLKNISKSNTKYQSIYDDMASKFKELFEEEFLDVEFHYNNLLKKFNSYKYGKELRNKVDEVSSIVNGFVDSINKLDEVFKNIFQAGDKLRIKNNDLKDKYRQCKEDVSKYYQSLTICNDAINSYFSKIDDVCNEFDDLMSKALFEKAQSTLDTLEALIYNLYGNVDRIASLCNSVTEVIPAELEKLKAKNQELEDKGYLVSFAHIDDFVLKAYSVLDDLKKDFADLYFGDFDDVNKEIQSKIEEAYAKLENEVNAKENVELNFDSVDEKLTSIEGELIKLQKQYSAANEYYLIPSDIKARFDKYVVSTTNLSTLRREYESFTFVQTKNPASFMLEKLNKMDSIADEIILENEFFDSYFTSLKAFVEKTFKSIDEYEVALVQDLGKLRLNSCYRVYNKYKKEVDLLLDDLNQTTILLYEKPINIAYLKDSFTALSNKVDDIKININNDLNSYLMLNKSLLFANPLRVEYHDADIKLRQVEGLIEDGEYKLAQEKVNQVLDQYHVDTYNLFSNEN